MDEVLLRVEPAAEEFGVGVPRIRAWLNQGKLNRVKRGGRVYVIRGELESLLHGVCHLCGERFRRSTLRQRFCSGHSCRQKAFRFGLGVGPDKQENNK